MPRVEFDQLPDDARVWIFPAERSLNEAEQGQLLAVVDQFIDQWGAHAVPLTAGREMRYDRFLFVGVDQRQAGPSGCSIDALFRQTQSLEQQMEVELADYAPVLFRRGSTIERVPRDQFATLAAQGTIDLDTTVFDNTLTTVGDVQGGSLGNAPGQRLARPRLLLARRPLSPAAPPNAAKPQRLVSRTSGSRHNLLAVVDRDRA